MREGRSAEIEARLLGAGSLRGERRLTGRARVVTHGAVGEGL